MDNELMLISLRDREDPEVEKMFIQLEKNNSILYRFLNSALQKILCMEYVEMCLFMLLRILHSSIRIKDICIIWLELCVTLKFCQNI